MTYVKKIKPFDFEWIDAIRQVLTDEGKPMHVKDITNKIIKNGYYSTGSNRTPKNTVNSYLSTNKHLFQRVKKGVYKLIGTSAPAPHTTAGRVAPAVVKSSTSYSSGDSEYKCAEDFIDSKVQSKLYKEEMALLELIVNFRLPLVNGEVCFADILDNLEVQILDEEKSRPQSIDATLLSEKLNELNEQIVELQNKQQHNPRLSDLNGGLLNRMSSAAEKAQERLKNALGGKVEFEYPILGEFISGGNPKVVIYLKSIENHIRNSYCSHESVMAAVFVHEMFHAWNYFKAGRMKRSVLAIDEPMVEFETLYFLKELEAFAESQSNPLFKNVLSVRVNREFRVKKKQQLIGDVAAYGFGYYLFDKLSKSDVKSITWIETYSKKSAFINGSYSLVDKATKALKPVYPFKSEDKVMRWFEKIIFYGQATSKTVGKSAATKVGLDVSLRDLVLACIKIIGRKCFAAQELYAFAPIFKVCVPQYQNLENALKQQLDELVNEGLLDALPHDCYGMKLAGVEIKPMPSVPTPPTLVPAPTKFKGGYAKDPSIPFAVKFPDGDIIAEKTAVKTFIKSLQKIGFSNIQHHAGIIIKGYNLVSDVERPRTGKNKWQDYVDSKYIYTKLSNPLKKQYLYEIAEKLGISIKIYDI